MPVSVWEAVFMLVVLKIPVVYLGIVVWWAIRAEPTTGAGGDPVGVLAPLEPCGWSEWSRRRLARRSWCPRGPARGRGGRPARRAQLARQRAAR
ncbi:MAG TPA: hypothetical protein VK926_00105 [Gaiellaceae bacterium]|nr:hypothetical protein [Gaiellaceae bacterium]